MAKIAMRISKQFFFFIDMLPIIFLFRTNVFTLFFASGGKWVLFFSFHLMILLDLVVFLFSRQYYFWSTVLLAAVFQVLFNDPLKMHRVANSIKTRHLKVSISQIENILFWQKLLSLCITSQKKILHFHKCQIFVSCETPCFHGRSFLLGSW